MGPFTLFAPTNGAFINSSDAMKHEMMTDPKMLILGHIVKGSFPLEKLNPNGDSLLSMEGEYIVIALNTHSPGRIFISSTQFEA